MKHYRLISVLLCSLLCFSMVSGAAASPALLPEFDASDTAISVRLSADLDVLMPFDDTRTGWLNGLLKYTAMEIAFQQVDDTTWTRLTLEVDHSPVLQLTQADSGQQSQVTADLLPDASYTVSDG